MTFIRNVKRLFGLGEPPTNTHAPARPAPVEAPPAPVAAPPVSAPAVPVLPPASQKRDALFRFIVEKLSPYTNETDNAPIGLRLSALCPTPETEELMRAVLYANHPGQFEDDLTRHLANQYIHLEPGWSFEWQIVRDALPTDSTYRQDDIGLTVLHRPAPVQASSRVRLRALVGQTAQDSYLLDPAVKTDYCIGRGHTGATASGRIRTNDIVFLDADELGFDPEQGDPNLTVSRQHATIRYDAGQRRYKLFADPGGLPASGNKTKLLHADETVERADIPGMGYPLSPGDQIELGGDAKLLVEGA